MSRDRMASRSGDEEPRSSTSTLRCAIYTRKSTEEGLNQDFNTLEAQRDAAEAYIRSQRHAGWIALPERYDDGGYTGANLERPALRSLLADIAAGRIDCVIVYKVDRLSRSLLDFARLMDIFERSRVSLVSITQPLNTTSSLGRLTLNILLSFAEFERQMIADRTRDKMAAARRKGKWVGGTPVLGYDIAVGGGKLVVNPEEASRVQEIFAQCLEHRSLDAVLDEMEVRQWTTKHWRTREGKEHRLLALALKFEELIRSGAVSNYAVLAKLAQVSRSRVSQMASLLSLAPDIQEEILFLRPTEAKQLRISEPSLRKLTSTLLWNQQREQWRSLRRSVRPVAD